MRPIIVGGDIGAYATARAFHEAYGVPAVVLAGVRVGAVAHSRIVDLRIRPGLNDPDTLAAAVLEVAGEAPNAAHLVLGSADWLVETIVAVRERLESAGVVVPYPGGDLVSQVSDKAALMDLAARCAVPHPRTARATPRHDAAPPVGEACAADLQFPVVVKPASTAAARDLDYPGMAKVHVARDAAELHALWDTMRTAGVGVQMLVQEFVPGPDSAMVAVNVFIDPGGRVRIAQFGRVLLEEYTPSAMGNSVAQLTGDAVGGPAEAVAGVVRLLRQIGWHGFANADLKRDADGTYRLLEINPRVGRSGYAVTASGYNVAAMYGAAFLGRDPSRELTQGPVRMLTGTGTGTGSAADGPAPRNGDRTTDSANDRTVEAIPLATAGHLFTVVPWVVLRRYLPAPLRAQVRRVRRTGAVTNPLYYRVERHPRRWAYIAAAMVNYALKLRRHHPGS